MRFDLGHSARDPDLFHGIGESLVVTVREVGGPSIETLENELGPEFPRIHVVKNSDDNGNGRVEQEELSQEICGEQGFFAQYKTEADSEDDGYEADGQEVKNEQEQNQENAFLFLFALDVVKIRRSSSKFDGISHLMNGLSFKSHLWYKK